MPVEPIIFIKYDRNAPPTSDARSYIRGYAKKLKGTRTDEGYSAEEYDDAFKFNTWPTAGKFMSIANNQADVSAWKNSNPINDQKEINMSKGNNFSSSSIKIQYRKDKRDEVIKFLEDANIRWSDLSDKFMKITSLDNISVESKISGHPYITPLESNSSIKIQYRKDKRDEVIKFLEDANIRWSDLSDKFMKITSLDNISVESKISGMPHITHVPSNFSSNINPPVRMRKKLY